MRFPELLQLVNKITDSLGGCTADIAYLQGQIYAIQRALIAAYPASEQILRHQDVSRETTDRDRGVDDGTPTPF